MKNLFLLIVFVLLNSSIVFSQAAINTDGAAPDNSAMLDVKSTSKGFLPPRVALTAVNVASPVTSPATGLLVYNIATAGTAPNNVVPGNYYWNGTRWIAVTPPVGTSTGDMLYWNGTQWVRVPVGTTGQILQLNGTVPTWGSSATAPIVNTNTVTNISSVSATGGGNITDGGSPVTARGVCWSLAANPTIADPKTTDGVGAGAFTSNITGLTANLTYHVRAYATNSIGTNYGYDVTFTTINIVTAAATAITASTATSGGAITSDGGSPITARGVCWNIITAPTTANFFTSNGTGTGTFTSSLTALSGNTIYYVRAYITNGSGTFYGNEVTFVTSPTIPVVTTGDTLNLTKTTVQIVNNNVTNDGGNTVTARGTCWGTTSNPTISGNKTTDGGGMGLFASSIAGLTQNTTYHVRAYATNSAGTGYGSDVSFVTKGTTPTVTTDAVQGIANTSAVAYGTITASGSSSVTERGFCWSASTPTPTISNSKLACGSGVGSFNGVLTFLAPNTTFHLRAYATNAQGTSYGADFTFNTLPGYYEGFESGMPNGWNGMWSLSTTNHYERFYSLFSDHTNDTISFTRTITTASGGQVSFWYYATNYNCNYGSYSADTPTRTQFFIDNVLMTTCTNTSWSVITFPVTAGTHTFKWKNIGRSGTAYCWSDGFDGSAWIDYIICPN